MKKFVHLALFFLIFITGCTTSEPPVTTNTPAVPVKVEPQIEPEEYLRIVTTNKFLYYMVKDIVQDRHNVDYMMKDEEEQWNFQFTEDSLNSTASKDLFIYFGGDFEPWAPGFVDNLKKEDLFVVNGSRGIRLLPLSNAKVYNDAEFKDNPYYWMNFDYYKIALSNIKNAIQQKDPRKSSVYEENFDKSIKKLEEMDSKLNEELNKYKEYTFITIGDELDYFSMYFDIKSMKFNSSDELLKIKEQLDKKENDLSKAVFICDDDEKVSKYKPLMDLYNIKIIKISNYSKERDFIGMLEDNYNELKKLSSDSNEVTGPIEVTE